MKSNLIIIRYPKSMYVLNHCEKKMQDESDLFELIHNFQFLKKELIFKFLNGNWKITNQSR